MNSYPIELLAQLSPIMFVAGLEPSPIAAPSTTIVSTGETLASPPPTPSKSPPLEFEILTQRLREGFASQRRLSIWQPTGTDQKDFHIIQVDSNVRFPPRKSPWVEDSSSSGHSPLSPLTASSPLYPDGLIAPIWIRKHTTLVPSVFVLFLRLFEYPKIIAFSPLDAPDEKRDLDKEQEEKRRDLEMSAEIALRKKNTIERGIKLTVVLMASRKMLDDPSLDARLTFIRRQSGLDSRAALFVLSPVSQSELDEFIRSLQDALFESAMEYYTNHSKRVRRKRNKHSSQAPSSYIPPALATGKVPPRPLRPEGWTVRYEYKMACFAEFRGDDEVALKHYQDAYSTLVNMFGSTAILPPRTKRWAEAKVLADTISIKISKLYLYNDETALALSSHSTHIKRFADFSRGWGIGEETFEFWSWMARQYRIFAELVEQGTQSALVIPTHEPFKAPVPPTLDGPRLSLSSRPNTSFGLINPSHVLHHPGFYFYMAAKCTEHRRERFLAIAKAEEDTGLDTSPGFANERKIDHLGIILELYTKAYELFKKNAQPTAQAPSSVQNRMTHYIAFLISQNYFLAGKLEKAVPFFERIARTLRREKWWVMLHSLLSMWYSCVKQLGEVKRCVQILVEMMATPQKPLPGRRYDEELLEILKENIPDEIDDASEIDFYNDYCPLRSSLIFWEESVIVGQSTPFQLILESDTDISAIPFSSLTLWFSHEGIEPLTIHQNTAMANPEIPQMINVGNVCVKNEDTVFDANLRWKKGGILVIMGSMSLETPVNLTISKIVLKIREGAWNVNLSHELTPIEKDISTPSLWYLSSRSDTVKIFREDSSILTVLPRPHTLLTQISHSAPAYVSEIYPVQIRVENPPSSMSTLTIMVDVLLQPTPSDDPSKANEISLAGQMSTTLIKGVSFGTVAPGESSEQTLEVINRGDPGERVLDISLQSRLVPPASEAKSISVPSTPITVTSVHDFDVTETLHTINIPTVLAFEFSHSVSYRHSLALGPGLFSVDDDESKDVTEIEALASTELRCVVDTAIVESIRVVTQHSSQATLLGCSVQMEGSNDPFPSEFQAGDTYSIISRLSLPAADSNVSESALPISPGVYEVNWRRIFEDGKSGPLATTLIELPILRVPQPNSPLVALLSAPPNRRLHAAFILTLRIKNLASVPSELRRAANITVDLSTDDNSAAWAITGIRSARIPILLPGTEEILRWCLIPLECGFIKLPKIRVLDRREGDEKNVRTVDVRWDQISADEVGDGKVGSVLVLP